MATRRKRGGNNVLFYSIILISSYFIVSKFRMPLYHFFKMPTSNKIHWQVPLFILLIQVLLLTSFLVDEISIYVITTISYGISFLYSIWVISQRKLYIGCDIGLITTLILLLNASVHYLPISNYDVWSNMLCRIYLCPFIVFMAIFDFITLIYLALHNDKDFLIRLWNGE